MINKTKVHRPQTEVALVGFDYTYQDPLVCLLPILLKLFSFSSILTSTVPDESSSENAPCAINLHFHRICPYHLYEVRDTIKCTYEKYEICNRNQ
jgi:hypothetical protein